MKKEKIEIWEKEFDKLTNAIKFEENLKGKNIVTNEDVEIVNSDFLAKRFRRILRHYFKPFIKELLKSEKEKLLERIRLKKWERTKRRDVIATEMNRIMCETRNNTIKELEKLKEEIKKEEV